METTAPPGRRSLPPVPPVAGAPQHAETVRVRTSPRRRPVTDEPDDAQRFVARLRAAAPDFARAAGAASAVVTEVVPPARHRRSRCRVVLRRADGDQVDVTFLGRATPARGQQPQPFDEQIRRWLADGEPRHPAWEVVDRDSPGGTAVDLTAWSARD